MANELDWQRDIDRLVDGEMTAADESQLLARLDATSEGWKRLALAFVESRRWRQALSAREVGDRQSSSRARVLPAVQPLVEVTSQRATVTSAICDSGRSAAVAGIVAMRPGAGVPSPFDRLFLAALAMSLLVGVAGGLGISLWRSHQTSSVAGGVNPPGGRELPLNSPVEPGNRKASRGAQDAVWSQATPGSAIPIGRNVADGQSDDETLTLIVGDESPGSAKQIDVPLVPASQVDPQWLDASTARVPETVRKAWEQQGRQVDVQRRYYPVDLNDGRRVLVPIDDVEVRTIGVQ